MKIIFDCETNIGNKRTNNEDSLWPKDKPHLFTDSPYGMLFLVADGMGGHGAGDIASSVVAEEVHKQYYAPDNSTIDIAARLEAAIKAGHQKICERVAQSPEIDKMGTTIVAAVLKYDDSLQRWQLEIGWVGDSRIYLLRDGILKQLSEDHSELWPMIQAKMITWQELHYHPRRSKITNSLTARRPNVTVEQKQFQLRPGDQLLLCSDGLTSEVPDQEIQNILASQPPSQAVKSLIQKAKTPKEWIKEEQKIHSEGGEDNITVIVVEIPGGPPRAAIASLPAMPSATSAASAPASSSNNKRFFIGAAIVATLFLLILVVVGGAIGIFWFNSSGDSTPMMVVTATETSVAKVMIGDPAATPTIIKTPTTEPTLKPGETRLSTSTRASTNTPSPTASSTPTTRPVTNGGKTTATTSNGSFDLSTLQLVEPKEGDTLITTQDTTFKWRWNGTLPEGHTFELLLWFGNETHYGACDARTAIDHTGDMYTVTCKLEGAESVKINGSQENYHWSVAIVQIEPAYKRIVELPTSWRVIVNIPGGSKNDGKSNGGGSGGFD